MEYGQVEQIIEKIEQKQQRENERHNKLVKGLENNYKQKNDFNIEEMVATAHGFLDGSIDPVKLGMDKCIEYTAQCNSAIKVLSHKERELRLIVGLSAQQNKLEQYKKATQEIEQIRGTIELFETFI